MSATTSNMLQRLDSAERENELRERKQRGMAAAYREHSAGLTRLAFLLTGDASLADDLVQEAFVRTFARFGYLRRPDALGRYLRRTLVNLAGKQLRKKRNERAVLDRLGGHRPAPPMEPDIELRERLWSALRQLPHRQRAALVLRFYEDRTEREVARILGCRVGTVKSLTHRGLASMRKEIGDDR